MNGFSDLFWIIIAFFVLAKIGKGLVSSYFKMRELNIRQKETDLRQLALSERNKVLHNINQGKEAQRDVSAPERKARKIAIAAKNVDKPEANKAVRPQATKVVPVRNDKEWEVYYEPAFIRKGKSIEGVAGSSRSSEKTNSGSKKRPSNPKAMMRDFKKGINHQSI